MSDRSGPPNAPGPGPGRPQARYPFIARVCFHLNWLFAVFWAVYLGGPDATGVLPLAREGAVYGGFTGAFFLLHFVAMGTGIIALFVVIIEVHARRPVRGFPGVLTTLALPVASFLYFAARFLAGVNRWLNR